MKLPVVLLVEDEEDDAFFFKRAIQKSGFSVSVDHAVNGAAAIETLQKDFSAQTLPQIIFVDLKMPVLNGFDLLAWLKKDLNFSQVPVIVLSGSDVQQDKEKAVQLGALAYLIKPLETGMVRSLFDKFLGANPDDSQADQPKKS